MSNNQQIRESLIFEGGDEGEKSKCHKTYQDNNDVEEDNELTDKDKKIIGGVCSLICLVIVIIIACSIFSSSKPKVVVVVPKDKYLWATPPLVEAAYKAKINAAHVKIEKQQALCHVGKHGPTSRTTIGNCG